MSALPTALAKHFATQATIGMSELAAILPMDPKTLKRHIADERLRVRYKGIGRIRPRRCFIEQDIVDFLLSLENASRPAVVAPYDPTRATMNMRLLRKRS